MDLECPEVYSINPVECYGNSKVRDQPLLSLSCWPHLFSEINKTTMIVKKRRSINHFCPIQEYQNTSILPGILILRKKSSI
jgi:hypothetical protein